MNRINIIAYAEDENNNTSIFTLSIYDKELLDKYKTMNVLDFYSEYFNLGEFQQVKKDKDFDIGAVNYEEINFYVDGKLDNTLNNYYD